MFRQISLMMVLLIISATNVSANAVPASDRSRLAIQHASTRLAPLLQTKDLTLGQPVYIRIFKKEAVLELWLKKDGKYQLFHTWSIADFSGQLGPKTKEGDCQAPEGFYFVTAGMFNPHSGMNSGII